MSAGSGLESARRAFDRALTGFVIALLTGLALLILVGVAFRKLGLSLVWYDEGASILLAWLTYYGAALAALKRAHIGFPGLVNALPHGWRIAAVLFGEACIVAFFAVLAWYGTQVLVILQGDTMVSLPEVPTRFTQSVIPIGAALFIVAQLLSLPAVLRQARAGALHDRELAALETPRA